MKKTFDSEKYKIMQTKKLENNISNNYDHIYLEIGGKFLDDQHASRVLSGFESNIKYEIIKRLNIDKEFIVCISSYSILKNKKRRDTKQLYTEEFEKMLNFIKSDGYKISVCLTRYHQSAKVNQFIEHINNLGYKVYKLNEIEGYPYDKSKIFSKEGLEKNDYIPISSKLVCIIGPGPNSGKFATAVSQIYHDNLKEHKKSTYRKYETFLIPELSMNNPINLSCTMAMCDVYGTDMIDKRYFNKTGEIHCIDERDNATFELLHDLLFKEEKDKIDSFSETMINETYNCIFDLKTAESHAKKEIIRRYKDYENKYVKGKMSQIEFNEANRVFKLIESDLDMSEKEMKFSLKKAMDFWGYECQSNVALEELGELIQAICKYKREEYDKSPQEIKDNLLEEIADVHNMINQLEMYFGEEKIRKIRIKKVLRTKELLKKEIYESSNEYEGGIK